MLTNGKKVAPPVSVWTRIYEQFLHVKGLLASLIAAIGLTVSPVLSRRAADVGVPGFQLVLVNELCKFALFVPLALIFRVPLRGNNWKQTVLMLANGVLRVVGGTLIIFSVLLIPPGNVFAIGLGAVSPICGMIIAWLIMREAPGWPNVIGIVFQVAGVIMVVFGGRPVLDSSSDHSHSLCANETVPWHGNSTDDRYNVTCNITDFDNVSMTSEKEVSAKLIPDAHVAYVVGNALAFICPLILAFVDVINRRNLKDNAKLTCLVLVECWGFVLILPIMFITSTPKWNLELELVFCLIGQGVIMVLAVGCLYNGLTSEKATTVYIMLGLSTVLGYVLQYFVIYMIPQTLELIGASIIVLTIAAVVGITWKQRAKKEKSETEQEDDEKEQLNNVSAGLEWYWVETSV